MNRKVRILGVAPYQSMRDTMLRVANEREDIEVTAVVGNVEAGADIVRQYEGEDFDAILSRGGTLLEIQKVTDKPVFEIPISYFDLLNVIKLVENYTGKVAIITYPNITKSAKVLCDILHYDYKVFTIHSWKDARDTVQIVKQNGYSLIIGDTMSTYYAQLLDIRGILLTSGKESISQAYDDAVRVCTYYARIKREHDLLEALMRTWNARLIVLDGEGNPAYQTAPNERKSFFTLCRHMLPTLQQRKEFTVHKKMQNGLYMVTGKSCRIYSAVYYLFVIEQNRLDFQSIPGFTSVEVRNYDDCLNQDASSTLFCGSGRPEMKKRCSALARSDASLLILADSGTGKERCAQQLYMDSDRTRSPFYVVNCSLMSQKDLEFLLYEKRSPLYVQNGTVYFKDVQLLGNDLFDKLVEGLQHVTRMRKSRLFFSYESNSCRRDVSQDNYRYRILKELLSCMEIRLPQLCDCADDIPNISILYIHQQNRLSGSQIVGLEPEALDVLQNYRWPHNMKQLERILHEAILLTDSPWISAKTIRQLLKEDKSVLFRPSAGAQIDLKQPLSGILFDAVMQVLAEENMNQSSTARRLGIGRSTLWRILKKGK